MLFKYTIFLTTISERLQEGVIALISGMATVFTILILISLIITMFKFLQRGEKKEIEKVPVVHTEPKEKTDQMKDEELVAIITAAIASSLQTTTDRLYVKSFRRIQKKK